MMGAGPLYGQEIKSMASMINLERSPYRPGGAMTNDSAG